MIAFCTLFRLLLKLRIKSCRFLLVPSLPPSIQGNNCSMCSPPSSVPPSLTLRRLLTSHFMQNGQQFPGGDSQFPPWALCAKCNRGGSIIVWYFIQKHKTDPYFHFRELNLLKVGQSCDVGSSSVITCYFHPTHSHPCGHARLWCCRHNIDVNLSLIQNLSLVIFPPS